MSDAPETEVLNLSREFPPTPTAEWEAAVLKDLQGADHEKKLIWHTEEGIPVRPYYRREDLESKPSPVRGDGLPWEPAQALSVAPDAIRADQLHEAGANAVQELGYAIAAAVERLAELTATLPIDRAAGAIEFVFAIGGTYFMEIAKFRAARLLWAQAVAAFGGGPEAGRIRLVARTSRRNKSVYDRYSNLLRATTEAMAAAIGGSQSLMVEPFGFDDHLALNVPRILQNEAHLDAVADAAGGSYYIEALTDAVAREAWTLFQQVEAEGGYSKARQSGSVERALAASRAAREKSVAGRRRTLVGVNNYPDLSEKTSDVLPPADAEESPFPAFRLAEPFEEIRRRTTHHAAHTGCYPKVLLLQRGDPKISMARANFSRNFFGCAGFDIEEAGDCAGTDADLIVLCGSDPEYFEMAREVCPHARVPVIVAGNPKDRIEALRAAGVQGFIHAASDAVETLTEWQDRLGMEA
jgi:methylmalonyl-CoA mutase